MNKQDNFNTIPDGGMSHAARKFLESEKYDAAVKRNEDKKGKTNHLK